MLFVVGQQEYPPVDNERSMASEVLVLELSAKDGVAFPRPKVSFAEQGGQGRYRRGC